MKRIYLSLLLSFAVFAQTNLVRVPASTVGGSGAKCQLRGVAATRTAAIDSINGVYNNPYFEFTVTTSGRYDLYYDSNGTTGGLSYSKQTDWSGTYGRWIDGMLDAERALTLQETADTDNDGKVETAGLEDSVITSVKLAGNQVKTVHLQNSIVTNAKIASDAVDSSKVGTGTLGRTDLADSLINEAKLTTAINTEIDNLHLRYNIFDETVTFAGQNLAGAIAATDSGFTIQTGNTGAPSYKGINFSLTKNNRIARLTGKTLKVYMYLSCTSAFLDDVLATNIKLTVNRSSGTATNQHSSVLQSYSNSDSTEYSMSFQYTVTSVDTNLFIFHQINNSTNVTRDITLKIKSVQYEVLEKASVVANTATQKEILENRFYQTEADLDNVEDRAARNIFDVDYWTTDLTFSGEALNGATFSDSGLTIPAGQTGTTSYKFPKLFFTNYERRARLTGKKIRLTTVLESPTTGFVDSLSSALTLRLSVVTPSTTKTNQQSNVTRGYINTDSTLYKFTMDYTVTSTDSIAQPFYQIQNTNTFASDLVINFKGLYYTIIDTNEATFNTQNIDAAIDQAIYAYDTAPEVLNIIKVKKDFTGDYSTIDSAITAVTNSSITNPYEIRIYPGIYEEYYLTMKPYITLRGMGNGPEDVWMKGYQPTGTSLANVALKSTLEFDVSGGLENMKFTAQNMRYVIHSETAASTDSTIVQTVDNCIFEHYGNQEIVDSVGTTTGVWLSTNAWGMGMTGGEKVIVKNSLFKSVSIAFSTHNDVVNVYHPVYVELENCQLVSTFNHPQAAGNGVALSLQSLGSTFPDQFVLKNTTINGWIEHTDNPWSTGVFSEQDRHDEYRITGGSNTPTYYKPAFTSRVLRITSDDSTATSDVAIAGANADTLFGATIDTSDGAVGFAAWAQGTVDVSHFAASATAADSAHFIALRLGNCTSVNKSFTVAVDGGGTQTITFDQDYRGLTSDQILDSINIQLSGATASLFNPSQMSFPNFGDEYINLKNVSATTLLRGMAVADTLNFIGMRRMTSSDDIYSFIGVVVQDVKPGESGFVRIKGYVAIDTTAQGVVAKQWTYGAASNGTNYGIDPAHPGYFKANETPTLLRGKSTGIGRILK